MIVGTPASRKLCAEIASKTDTVVLGFSRGKDSVAAWLWLREFFPRVISFHVDGCPGLGFVERSLAYYERFFGATIERCYARDLFESLANMVYQPVEDEDWIDGLELMNVAAGNDEIAERIRDKHDLGHAWMAWGISSADSIVRRSQKKYREGVNEAKRVFYPCFDWHREHVLQAIAAGGARLPEDYLLCNRSIASVMNLRGLERMRDTMPDEFERVKFWYPFIEASLARNEFRRLHRAAERQTGPAYPTPEAE